MVCSVQCSCRSALTVLVKPSRSTQHPLPPNFLLPAFKVDSQRSAFSTSSSLEQRKERPVWTGVSALKKTGLKKRIKFSVRLEDLPQPVLDPKKRPQITTNPDHGLWGFFNNARSPLPGVADIDSHGRAWTVDELRRKSFDDLWKLFWTCAKETNRVLTYERERARMDAGHGEAESLERLKEVRKTQKHIKGVLTERWYQFEAARKIAQRDPNINLNADVDAGESGLVSQEREWAEAREAEQRRPEQERLDGEQSGVSSQQQEK